MNLLAIIRKEAVFEVHHVVFVPINMWYLLLKKTSHEIEIHLHLAQKKVHKTLLEFISLRFDSYNPNLT